MVSLKDVIKGFESELLFSCNYVAEKSVQEVWERRLTYYCLGARLKLKIAALPLEKESRILEENMIKEPGNDATKRWSSTVGELLSKHHGKELFLYRITVAADRKRRKELDVERIELIRGDIAVTLKESDNAYIELLDLLN
jgi:hypothetical protein